MLGQEISVDEVRAQLRRVLASPEFSDSEDARELLRFCVEKTVCGEQDVLQESSLTLVAESAKIRDRLKRYYATRGIRDTLIIELPENDFVPHFRYRSTETPAHIHHRSSKVYWALLGGVLAIAILGTITVIRSNRTPSQGPVLHRVTSDLGLTSYPALSRDGKLLVYASDRSGDGNLDLWIQNTVGGPPFRLTQHPADEREPSLSGDGANVVYRSERQGGGIYVTSSKGGPERLLVEGGRGPRFSPDSKWVLYWVEDLNFHPSTAWVISVDGGTPRRIAPDFQDVHTPIWSPDGKHVLFCGTRNSDIKSQGHDWYVMQFPDGPIVKTGAFQIADLERARPSIQNALDSSQWYGDSVIYTAQLGDSTNVYRLKLTPGTWRAKGPVQRLTFGTSMELYPTVAGNRLVFTSGIAHSSVWALPLDAETGQVSGELQRHTQNAAAWEYYPSVSSDGGRISFLSTRNSHSDIYLKNLQTRTEIALTTGGGKSRSSMSRDGIEAAYRQIEQDRRSQAIYSVPTAGGSPKRLCADCGIPTGWSTDRKWILFETGKNRATVGALDTSLGPDLRYQQRPQTEVLWHPAAGVHAGRFSPDDRWIVFHADSQPGHKQVFVAPFRGEQRIDPSEWIPITDGTTIDQQAVFSPAGNILYFLSERDGFRCIWASKMDRKTMHPTGSPFPVKHFHSSNRSLFVTTGERPDAVGISAAKDKLIFSLDEVTSNLWSTELPN